MPSGKNITGAEAEEEDDEEDDDEEEEAGYGDAGGYDSRKSEGTLKAVSAPKEDTARMMPALPSLSEAPAGHQAMWWM